MLTALLRAIAALPTPPLRRVVVLGLGLSTAVFALLWLAVAAALYRTTLFAWTPLNWLVDLLGGLAVLAVSWLLFPAVVTLILGFFLDSVAAAVETREYPGKPPPRRQRWMEIIVVTLRLGAITILLNLLAVPLYVLIPGINLFLFVALNGYLFGRGYFEVVALRRFDAAAAKTVRQRFMGRIWLAGVAITGMFALPFVNLVAPVLATAFMVHVFETLPREAQPPAARPAG